MADSEPGHKVYYLGRDNLGAVHGEDQDSRATIIHVSTLSFSFLETLTLGQKYSLDLLSQKMYSTY